MLCCSENAVHPENVSAIAKTAQRNCIRYKIYIKINCETHAYSSFSYVKLQICIASIIPFNIVIQTEPLVKYYF